MIPSPDRRTFLATAAGAIAAAEPRVPVIDAHLHCFAGRSDPKFPYHAEAPYTPDAATPEHLLHCMAGAAVDYAVVVHPEPYGEDHSYLEHCLKIGKGRLKGTALFFAERDGAAKRLAALAKALPLVAARVHAYCEDRLPPFGKPELRSYWKAIGDAGLAVQLHFEPRWAEGFESLIREFKDVRVFVDHLGRPFQGLKKEHARVLAWSKLPNVVMKLSAVPNRGTYPHRDPQPVVKQLTEAFGADRLMFGGGFGPTATPASYRAERDRVSALLAHLSETDRAKILGGTAAKLMGFQS